MYLGQDEAIGRYRSSDTPPYSNFPRKNASSSAASASPASSAMWWPQSMPAPVTGAIARALAEAGVNILIQYSDHHNRLILICDRPEAAAEATRDWEG